MGRSIGSGPFGVPSPAARTQWAGASRQVQPADLRRARGRPAPELCSETPPMRLKCKVWLSGAGAWPVCARAPARSDLRLPSSDSEATAGSCRSQADGAVDAVESTDAAKRRNQREQRWQQNKPADEGTAGARKWASGMALAREKGRPPPSISPPPLESPSLRLRAPRPLSSSRCGDTKRMRLPAFARGPASPAAPRLCICGFGVCATAARQRAASRQARVLSSPARRRVASATTRFQTPRARGSCRTPQKPRRGQARSRNPGDDPGSRR